MSGPGVETDGIGGVRGNTHDCTDIPLLFMTDNCFNTNTSFNAIFCILPLSVVEYVVNIVYGT